MFGQLMGKFTVDLEILSTGISLMILETLIKFATLKWIQHSILHLIKLPTCNWKLLEFHC